ncbi:MAG TPA: cytidine deaminase [Caulobacteraceae bacterium]
MASTLESSLPAGDLIVRAAAVINARRNGDYTVGDVGCALVTAAGNVHVGVCIDAMSGMGFCAEHNAIGAMVTAGETRIARIVAVWKEGADTYVVAPCGRCRQFIFETDKGNLDTEILLGPGQSAPLRDLLPFANSFRKI